MTKIEIIKLAARHTEESPLNYITEEAAIAPKYAGMRIFDAPILAFGSADDEIYLRFKSPEVIGAHFVQPIEWLLEVKTVISFFLPYRDEIKIANAASFDLPADEWLHGRFEGQMYVQCLSTYISDLLNNAGFKSLVPASDPRFGYGGGIFTSNWSERHAAFACGLGTFGLSKGIITEKGTCGRIGSVITTLDLPKDERAYEGVYEYCATCGACAANCPANAITLAEGKDHALCSDFLEMTRERFDPRYGCGKCQVKVPCESGIPIK